MVYRHQAIIKRIIPRIFFAHCVQAQIEAVRLVNRKHFAYGEEISYVY